MPVTLQQYGKSLSAPALCEQLRIRDLLDNVAIQVDGSFVAGYELGGLHSYYASDEMRNRDKNGLEALVRSLPERSMRMQVRFEIAQGYGDLVSRYNREQRNQSPVLQAVDHVHADLWRSRDCDGLYLRHILHAYFIWNPRIRQSPDLEWKKKMRGSSASLSATKCIERTRREHEDLLAEFNSLMSGVEATLQATGMAIHRMPHDSIFHEVKRALNPVGDDGVPYRPPEGSLVYDSARSQMANVNIEDETDDYYYFVKSVTKCSKNASLNDVARSRTRRWQTFNICPCFAASNCVSIELLNHVILSQNRRLALLLDHPERPARCHLPGYSP